MSDRQRRWICRFLFLLACLVPTCWTVVRIRTQPTVQQWGTELLVKLGMPWQVREVTTPDPSTIIMTDIVWDHPEQGRLLEIGQLTITQDNVDALDKRKWQQVHVLPEQIWHINELKVRENALPEVLRTLNQYWLSRAFGQQLPELHIDQLLVIRSAENSTASGFAAPVDTAAATQSSSTVLRLVDVVVRSQVTQQVDSNQQPNSAWAISVLGTISPLDPPTIVGGREWQSAGVPFALRTQRLVRAQYFTEWLLQLDKPLPLRYVNLRQVPRVLVQENFSVQGSCIGYVFDDQWSCRLYDTRLMGPEVLEGKFQLAHLAAWFGVPEGRAQIDGLADLNVASCTLRQLPNSKAEMVELDARLVSKQGAISHGFLARLRNEFRTSDQPPELTIPQFDNLDIRLYVRDGRLRLLPGDMLTQQTTTLIKNADQVILSATEIPYFLANLNEWVPASVTPDPWNCLSRLMPMPSTLSLPDRSQPTFDGSTIQQVGYETGLNQ